MNIGIDARVLEKGITGIGRYLQDILKELPSIDKINRYYLFSYNDLGINPDYYDNISTCKPILNDKLFSPYWLNFILPGYIKKYQIDIFFTPNHLLPLRSIKAKSVITVHDVANKKNNLYHSLFYRLYIDILLPSALKHSYKIITISESAKSDIIANYKMHSEKIKVIYRQADKKFVNIFLNNEERDNLKRKYGFPDTFILYVGVIENRKNIPGILKTADIISQKNVDIGFVLIGRKGYGANKIVREINKRSKYVNYLGVIDDSDLIKIYNMAFAFLFPSYYEGFGLPPLEAMQVGLPVLVSDRSSLPEIIEDGGIIKDADDVKGFAEEIMKLYNDSGYYHLLKSKGLEQALRFNSESPVLELVNTFNELKL